MTTLKEIKSTIETIKPKLKEQYKVKTIGVFGSYVRGEENKKSDVDVLVEFEEPIGLFEFMDLEMYLSILLGVKVDLVSKKALKTYIGKRVLEEVVMV
ncbi:MAG TPA: nucleotidyltransferase family protein [Candidatus Deferrimicrobiaceae bacterium]|jgi:predicted nucleotidyltransferase|nr:nucleotidyltransferase family protein [Candidatus Deferrimicrobiaceae bacterium]